MQTELLLKSLRACWKQPCNLNKNEEFQMTRLPDRTRSRAILIGTTTYEDAKHLPSLPAVRRSIEDFAAALTSPTSGVLPAGSCKVMLDRQEPFWRELVETIDEAE